MFEKSLLPFPFDCDVIYDWTNLVPVQVGGWLPVEQVPGFEEEFRKRPEPEPEVQRQQQQVHRSNGFSSFQVRHLLKTKSYIFRNTS